MIREKVSEKIVEHDSILSNLETKNNELNDAIRKDELTIKRHLELLDKHPEYKKIYRLLSEQLIRKYHE